MPPVSPLRRLDHRHQPGTQGADRRRHASAPQRFIDKHCAGATFADPYPAILAEIEAHGDEVDLCVVLGHINRADVDRLAAEVPAIDVVVEPNSSNGSENTWIKDAIKTTLHQGTVLLKPSGQGSELSRADLWLRESGQPWVSIWDEDAPAGSNIADLSTVALAPHIGRHPAMEKIVQDFLATTRYKTPIEEQKMTFKPSSQFLGSVTCAVCHPQQTAFWKKTAHGRAYALSRPPAINSATTACRAMSPDMRNLRRCPPARTLERCPVRELSRPESTTSEPAAGVPLAGGAGQQLLGMS